MIRNQFNTSARAGVIIFVAATMAGCERNDVKVYQVPKESSASAPGAMQPMAAGESTAQPNLTWTLPEGWQEVPAGQMRVASFAVTGPDGKKADVSIIPLNGPAGGDLSNVIRWRGQAGLAPVSEDELARLGEKVEVAGVETKLFDFAGPITNILVTALPRDGTSWFFKMTGDKDLLVQQKGKFVAFLKSVKFSASAETGGALPADHPPIGETKPSLPPDHPVIGAAPAMMSSDTSAKAQWTAPSNWKEEPPTQMLLAKFSTGEKDAQATITVSSLGRDGGGMAANINRWRRQLVLPQVDDAVAVQAAKPLDVQSEKASLVELDGTDATTGRPARLLGVVVPHGDQTWFFKMSGDEKVVAREKDAFIKFVQTAKLPHAP